MDVSIVEHDTQPLLDQVSLASKPRRLLSTSTSNPFSSLEVISIRKLFVDIYITLTTTFWSRRRPSAHWVWLRIYRNIIKLEVCHISASTYTILKARMRHEFQSCLVTPRSESNTIVWNARGSPESTSRPWNQHCGTKMPLLACTGERRFHLTVSLITYSAFF